MPRSCSPTLPSAAPEVAGENLGLEADRSDDQKHHDRHDLGHGHDGIDQRSLADAAQDHRVHRPQQHRGARHRLPGIAFTEGRHEVAQPAEDQHEVADVAQQRTDPVAPGRREADVITEAGPRVRVDAGIQFGLAVGQVLEHEGQHQHAQPADHPADQGHARAGAARDVLRQREDAGTDHRPDHQGSQRGQAKPIGTGGHVLTMPAKDSADYQRRAVSIR